jgi:hypothetical protein
MLAFSIAFGGTASAWAAQTCPYNAAPAMHDCCPDSAMSGMSGSGHHSKKPADCQLGQACRASIAVAPNLPTLKVARVEPARPVFASADADGPAVLSFSFWRPPRTV